jgi:uncharacterized protein
MQIEIEKLDSAGEAFAHEYKADELDLGDDRARLVADANVNGRASKKGSEVTLRGSIATTVEIVCDRCAAAVALPLGAKFDASFLPAEAAAGTSHSELGKDELDYSIYQGAAVDLDELVREQILLALPMRQLCREDCKGLCASCGADLNAEDCACGELP